MYKISRISELYLLQPEELVYQRTDKAAAAELQDRSRGAVHAHAHAHSLCPWACNPKLDIS